MHDMNTVFTVLFHSKGMQVSVVWFTQTLYKVIAVGMQEIILKVLHTCILELVVIHAMCQA